VEGHLHFQAAQDQLVEMQFPLEKIGQAHFDDDAVAVDHRRGRGGPIGSRHSPVGIVVPWRQGQSREFDPQLMDDVHPDQLEVGEVFLVRPGERIPVDGTILDGESAVVEAHITGESLPVEKEVGSAVFAGAQNGDASLTVRATATAKESATSKLASLVAQSRLRQSPTERFVDRFAHWYTPVVIIIAAVIGLVVPLSLMSTGEPHFQEWLHRGLVLLVIACPCALVVSTPITLVCGLHRATRLGMLIKGGDYLEKMAALVGVAMDKTGTITTGSFDVVDVQSLVDEQFSADELLSCAAALKFIVNIRWPKRSWPPREIATYQSKAPAKSNSIAAWASRDAGGRMT
jgi:cation transport ATPase